MSDIETRLNEFCERRDLNAENERLRGLLREARDDLYGWVQDTNPDEWHHDGTLNIIAAINAAIKP